MAIRLLDNVIVQATVCDEQEEEGRVTGCIRKDVRRSGHYRRVAHGQTHQERARLQLTHDAKFLAMRRQALRMPLHQLTLRPVEITLQIGAYQGLLDIRHGPGETMQDAPRGEEWAVHTVVLGRGPVVM